jgi:bisphosphoglycerate-independent phosphoglycerate mutase (AlkP superfamily)
MAITSSSPNIMDIAPTVLKLFGVDPPKYMTGKDLLENENE